jgi:hypothetical protein
MKLVTAENESLLKSWIYGVMVSLSVLIILICFFVYFYWFIPFVFVSEQFRNFTIAVC